MALVCGRAGRLAAENGGSRPGQYVESFFEHIVDAAPVKGTADYWWLDYPGGASAVSGWTQQEAASLQWSNRMFAEHKRGMGVRWGSGSFWHAANL
jgi:hypothetical protein